MQLKMIILLNKIHESIVRKYNFVRTQFDDSVIMNYDC